jgi:hypothetical protein
MSLGPRVVKSSIDTEYPVVGNLLFGFELEVILVFILVITTQPRPVNVTFLRKTTGNL